MFPCSVHLPILDKGHLQFEACNKMQMSGSARAGVEMFYFKNGGWVFAFCFNKGGNTPPPNITGKKQK